VPSKLSASQTERITDTAPAQTLPSSLRSYPSLHVPMLTYMLLGLLAGILTGILIAWYRRQQ
jgi:predicted ABC-type sugar transport system permease subunit